MAKTVDEEHTFVVDGRRRRRSDPGIPEALRTETAGDGLEVRQRGNAVTDSGTVRGPVRLALRSPR